MTDTKRYILLWFAAAFLGLNGGAAALVLVGAFLSAHGMARAIVLAASFVIASLGVTIAVGRALVRLVSKQLN